jgi:hypothetical protein
LTGVNVGVAEVAIPLLAVGELGAAQTADNSTTTGLVTTNEAKRQHVQVKEEA